MIKQGLSLIFILLATSILYSQNCNGTFTDTGDNGLYSNNENYTVTLCPDMPATQIMELTFSQFDVSCSDSLEFFDGSDITAPSLGRFCGNSVSNGPSRITATNVSGCLTAKFVSDATVVGLGWEAFKACKTNIADRFQNFDLIDENLTVSACNKIEGDHAILGNSIVAFLATNEVLLLPGFQVEQGASFVADIEDCTANNLTDESIENYARLLPSDFQNLSNQKDKESLRISPNPFLHTTSIDFDLTAPSSVELQVYDLTGNLVQKLESGRYYTAGKHQVKWRNDYHPKGIYIVLLTTDKGPVFQKIVIQ